MCLRSPAVMSGYWRDPEQTAAAFTADGFVRTGDLGWIDDRGRLRLVGRSKEMYVRGGYNVYPVEVESVLSTHPDVAAIAIVPRADDVMGEIGVAVVVPRDPARVPTLDELRAFAAHAVAAYKLPEAIAVRRRAPAHGDGEGRSPCVGGRAERPRNVTPHGARVHHRPRRAARLDSRGARRTRARSRSPARLSKPVRDPTALWATMVELGWPALTIAEEYGGIGLGMLEAAILAEELGRRDRARPAARRPSRSSSPRFARRGPPSSARTSSATLPRAR